MEAGKKKTPLFEQLKRKKLMKIIIMSPQLPHKSVHKTIKKAWGKGEEIQPGISRFIKILSFLSAAINLTTRFINPDFVPMSNCRSGGAMAA